MIGLPVASVLGFKSKLDKLLRMWFPANTYQPLSLLITLQEENSVLAGP